MPVFKDRNEFNQDFLANYQALVQTAYRFTHRAEVAEDIVQDVFMKMWHDRDKLHVSSNKQAYFRKAVIAKSLSWWRAEHRVQLSEPDKFVERHHHDTDSGESVIPGTDELRKAIDQLPAKCKLVFKLHRFEGLTMSEISEYLGISPKTVENHLARAMRLLREILKEFQNK